MKEEDPSRSHRSREGREDTDRDRRRDDSDRRRGGDDSRDDPERRRRVEDEERGGRGARGREDADRHRSSRAVDYEEEGDHKRRRASESPDRDRRWVPESADVQVSASLRFLSASRPPRLWCHACLS
jgi:hypothetical protein